MVSIETVAAGMGFSLGLALALEQRIRDLSAQVIKVRADWKAEPPGCKLTWTRGTSAWQR